MADGGMNKKGSREVLSIWWFFILVIIGVGIVAGMTMFYGAEADTRNIEMNMLSDNILGCITNNGFIDSNLMSNDFNDVSLMVKCGLAEDMFNTSSKLYFSVKVFDEQKLVREISSSMKSFEKDCEVAKGLREAKNYPICVTKDEKAIFYDRGLKELKLEVIAASNQHGFRGKNE